ncbi:MAG: O-methyltransferase [Vicinamibacteraceae bacterium]|nr:O-methyltransferase [Vicinamibacteraceae bacterium]
MHPRVFILPALCLSLTATPVSAQTAPPSAPSRVRAATPGAPRAGAPVERAAPRAHQGLPAALAALLDDIRARDRGQLAVSEEDGRFLRALVAASGTRSALEIGGASGYSAIWIGLGLRETGGRLTTIEYDPQRARELKDNVARAGLSDIVTVVSGDAFAQIPRLQGDFDFVFLDAWKRDYRKFFELVFPRLRAGGLFLGHNVINKKDELTDFLDLVRTHPQLFTSIVAPSGEGISVSYKRQAAR